jgi:hypothetical protein
MSRLIHGGDDERTDALTCVGNDDIMYMIHENAHVTRVLALPATAKVSRAVSMFSVIRRAPALARPQICRHLASTIRRACISTLVSDRLVSTDLLDLSGQKQRDCHTTSVDSASEQSVRLSYKHEKPFPSSTRGYLYWHTPHPEHLAAGEIRFRLAPKGIDDPMAAFATGQDLYVSEETPWRVWAVAAARNRTQRALAEILVRDGVLPQRALDEWQHRALSPRPWTSVLLQLDQPFVCDLGDAINLYVADGLNLHRVVIKSLLRDRRRAEGDIGYVYTGESYDTPSMRPLSHRKLMAMR